MPWWNGNNRKIYVEFKVSDERKAFSPERPNEANESDLPETDGEVFINTHLRE